MRIPLSSLRYEIHSGNVIMGMNVYRWTSRSNERVTFPAVPAEFDDTKVSILQDVRLRDIESHNPVYVTPYVSTGVDQLSQLNDASSAYRRATDGTFDGGVDAKINPSPNLTVDLSVNTDFADVEVDQQQINLSRFPLFFEEKRPFFLERSGLFSFATGAENGRLFHSRRIGLVEGEPMPIIAGARSVARFGRVDLGALTMQTARHQAVPTEHFGVARLRSQILNTTSYVGGMVTTRLSETGAYNVTYGLDLSIRPIGDEYFAVKWLQTFQGGADLPQSEGRWDDSRLVLDWTRRRIRGFSYSTTCTTSGAGYVPAVGFEPRQDFDRLANSLDYQWFLSEDAPLRRIWIGHWGNVWRRHAADRIDTAWLHPFFWFETKNGATFLISTNHNYDDTPNGFSLSDDAEVVPGQYWMTEAWLNFGPPDGWRLQPIVTIQAGEFYDGTKFRLWTTLVWKASQHLQLEGDYQLNRIRFDERGQRFNSDLVGIRGPLAWNSKLSANVFVQYNNAIDRITSNVRIPHNFREGRDLWLVWNEGLNTDRTPLESFGPRLPLTDARTFTVKYSHTLAF